MSDQTTASSRMPWACMMAKSPEDCGHPSLLNFMPLNENQLAAILKSQLTQIELNHAVVYVASAFIPAGATLNFPGATIRVPREALLAFIDREPLANWGHSSRYVLLDRDTGEVISLE